MADLRTYFGATMVLALGLIFTSILYTQAMSNGGYVDSGQYPLANKSVGYLNEIQNKSVSLTQSMNATFSQSTTVDLGTGIYASAAVASQSMSIIWSLFLMVVSMVSTMFLAPIAMTLGVSQLLVGIGVAYVVGLLTLIIAGVVLKWFI
jgi:hypothetical protein